MYSIVFLCVLANASSLVILNNTEDVIRIESLINKCSGPIVDKNKPILIRPQWTKLFKIDEVVHTYNICGSGYCVSSAIGIDNNRTYLLKVYIEDGKLMTKESPNVWPGNLECK